MEMPQQLPSESAATFESCDRTTLQVFAHVEPASVEACMDGSNSPGSNSPLYSQKPADTARDSRQAGKVDPRGEFAVVRAGTVE